MILRLVLLFCLATCFTVTPFAGGMDEVMAATKKKKKVSKKSSDFTPAQREKLMQEARKICKKRYGAGATVYKLDYYHWKVWCLEG
jgi:hypothetical protein